MLKPSHHIIERQAKNRGFSAEYTSRVVSVAKSLNESKVPVVFSLMHLSVLSACPWSNLRGVINRNVDAYEVFNIKKRSGGQRRICSPNVMLRRVQRWIHKEILQAPGAIELLHEASAAYAPGSSILKNASAHTNAKWMVKIDIKDFFESISERQVFFVFRKLQYPPLLSFEMARLCTRVVPPRNDRSPRKRDGMWRWNNAVNDTAGPYLHQGQVGHLPQGASTSAMLANLVVAPLDIKLQAIADAHNAVYTRYADDIVITLQDGSRNECETILKDISKTVSLAGFRVNRSKSRIVPPGARKIVTGLVVNGDVPRLPRKIKNDISVSLHHIEKNGLLKHVAHRKSKSPLGYLNHLVGQILFAQSIEEKFGSHAMQRLREVLEPYRDLLSMIALFAKSDNSSKDYANLHAMIFTSDR